MIVFSQADGTITHVAITPVYQGSNLDGSIYFVAPLARRNTVNVAFKLPSGKFTDMYDMTAVDVVEGLSEELNDKWTIWQWAYGNAEVTEFAGTVTAQFIVSLPNGNVLTTASTSFEVLPGIKPKPPENPSDSVYDYIASYLSIIDDRTKNVPTLVASIQKVASNAFIYTNNSGESSAPIVLTGGEEAPMPVTPASTITIPKESDGWQPIYESDETTTIGYKYIVDAALHGQMRDGATANDLWVSFSAQDSTVFDGKYADYTVDAEGNITVTVSELVDLTLRVWNGKGLVDNEARAEIQAEAKRAEAAEAEITDTLNASIEAETQRAETAESSLQKQIDEIVEVGRDDQARADIAKETERAKAAEAEITDTLNANITAETERAETAESGLQQNIEAEQTRAVVAEESIRTDLANVENELSDKIAVNASDISGLREDIANESHFRGMFNTVEELRAAYPTATPNDYAWIAGGNIWTYNNENGWTNTGKPVPSTAVPASESMPLMDGIASVGTSNAYARGDHRHPEKPADSALSTTSENAVQNKVVTAALSRTFPLYGGMARVYVGASSTASTTAIKVVTMYNNPNNTFPQLRSGDLLVVLFDHANLVKNPYLQIGGVTYRIYNAAYDVSDDSGVAFSAGYIIFAYENNGSGTFVLVNSNNNEHPIGSIYMSTASTSPAELFGGAWTEFTAGYFLKAAGPSGTFTIGPAGLPNITGTIGIRHGKASNYNIIETGQSAPNAMWGTMQDSGTTWTTGIDYTSHSAQNDTLHFDASRSSSIYGKSNTVTPLNYGVHIWRRTA